jgi:hypothetical protein
MPRLLRGTSCRSARPHGVPLGARAGTFANRGVNVTVRRGQNSMADESMASSLAFPPCITWRGLTLHVTLSGSAPVVSW